jgi:polysaccharide export outer membrane protein
MTNAFVRAAIAALTVVTMQLSVVAQDQDLIRRDRDRDLFPSTTERSATTLLQSSGIALSSTVNPERYFVGPSDGIAVNIWMSPPMTFSLTVTPEGTLIVPTVGEIPVADLTLAQAKERIVSQVRKRYIASDITATLIKPRPIIVTVSGNVLNEGFYTLTAVDRAHRAIEEANKPTAIQRDANPAPFVNSTSFRNIVVRHKDGTQERIDITKYLATRDEHWNPYLREGDAVIVPRRTSSAKVFGIYGEVNSPGRYELIEGDSLTDAIQIAQGLTRFANADSAEFTRFGPDGRSVSTRLVDVAAIVGGQAQNVVLEPGDRIVIKGRSDLRNDYRVNVQGEVRFPGTYPITKERSKLSDAIRQAGGFTEFAAIRSAELHRRATNPADIETERLLSLRGGFTADDSASFIRETELRLRREVVNVSFERLFVQNDTTQDVYLQDEDYIFVPSVKRTIYVFGQIVSPGHIPYVDGQRAEYYIRKAGGFTDRARRGDVKIIKGTTKQWLDPRETTIEDGDYVWIPPKPDRSFGYWMNIGAQAASILSVVVGIAVVIVQVSK